MKNTLFIHLLFILVTFTSSCTPRAGKDTQNIPSAKIANEYSFYLDDGGTVIQGNFGPGNVTLEFAGRSQLANHQGGILEFTFENENAKQIKIDSTEFKPYILNFSLKGTSKYLRIKFLNDYFNPHKKEDRNVFMRKLQIKQ